MNLSKHIQVARVGAYKDTENTTDVEGSDVDFTGYDGVLFFAYVAKKTSSTDKNVLKVEQKNSEGSYGALSGAVAEATEDGVVLAVDVYRPLESQGKALRAVLDIDTASKTGDVYAVLYNGRIKPEDFADVSTLAISPTVA